MSEISGKKAKSWSKSWSAIIVWGVACALVALIVGTAITWEWSFPTRGKPLQETDLKEGVMHRKSAHPNLFLVTEVETDTPAKACFLPHDCPDQFVIVVIDKDRQIVPIPKKPDEK